MKITVEFDEKESEKRAINFIDSGKRLEQAILLFREKIRTYEGFLHGKSRLMQSEESGERIYELLNKFKSDFHDYL